MTTHMETLRLPLRVGTPDECNATFYLPRDLTKAELARVLRMLDAWALCNVCQEDGAGEGG